MVDYAASGRKDEFWAKLVDLYTLQEVGDLDIIPDDCSITYGYNTDNLYSASISTVTPQPNASNALVRLWHRVTIGDWVTEEPLGTFFVQTAQFVATYKRQSYDLKCYSTLLRYTNDVLLSDMGIPEGTIVGNKVKQIVEGKGGVLTLGEGVSLTSKVLLSDHIQEVGEGLSTTIRTMADWMGCQISCDGYGRIVLQEYLEPAKKPVKYTFDATNSVYLPGVSVDDGRDGAVNVVRVYYTTQDKTDGCTVELEESSPYSQKAIGRAEPMLVKLTEEKTHAELEALAKRYLQENSGAVKYLEIEHVQIPGLHVGDAVTYENDRDFAEPYSCKALVTEISIGSLTPGCMCKTKLKVIA